MFETVEFPSDGALLRGRFYQHAGRRAPALVMAHGTSATITMVVDQYAAAFHEAGLDVLLYDQPGFGASGGEPRQEINPWVQGRGYRDAVVMYSPVTKDDELTLTFNVQRGPRYIVDSVTASGNTTLTSMEIVEALRLKAGEPYVQLVVIVSPGISNVSST